MKTQSKTTKFILTSVLILIIMPSVLFYLPKQAKAQDASTTDSPINPLGGFKADLPAALTCSSPYTNPLAVAVTDPIVESSTCNSSNKQNLNWWQQLIVLAERIAAHKFLQDITTQTVAWINSGFHGSPLFVQNPDSLFNDIGKTEIKSLVNEFGYDPNRFPFGESFALNIINSYKQTLANNAQYTLSTAINDPVLLNNYRNNFNYGGWNGFLVNTQYPQNNYLGFQMIATNQLAQKLQGTSQSVAQKVQATLLQGQGFLSPTMCPPSIPNAAAYNKSLTNEFNPPSYVSKTPWSPPAPVYITTIPGVPGYNIETVASIDARNAYLQKWESDDANAKTAFNATSACINPATGKSALVATTPGSVVASQIMTATNSTFASGELGQAVGGSLSAILDALFSKLIGGGLSALGSLVTNTPTDNFSYNGQTLTSATAGGLVANQQNVPVAPGVSMNVAISGGKAPYSVLSETDTTVAKSKIVGSSVTITGTASNTNAIGTDFVIIQDSTYPTPLTTTITITPAPTAPLAIDFNNPPTTPLIVSVTNGSIINISLSGGTPDYVVKAQTDADKAIATALISGTNLDIINTGVSTTPITVVVQDSTSPVPKSVTVNVSTTDASTSTTTGSSSKNNNVSTNIGVGPYYWGGTVSGTSSANIIGEAESLADSLNTSTIRISLSPKSDMDYKNGSCIPNFTLAGLAARSDFNQILSDPKFSTIVITAYDGVTLGDCAVNKALDPNFFTPDNTAKIEAQYKDLATYLKTFNKNFIISNWEGDNAAYCDDRSFKDPASCPGASQNLIGLQKWLQAMTTGVASANASNVYSGVEFNIVHKLKDMGLPSMLYDVLPNVSADYYLYSSYESANLGADKFASDIDLIRTILTNEGKNPSHLLVGELGNVDPTQMKSLLTVTSQKNIPLTYIWALLDTPPGFGVFNSSGVLSPVGLAAFPTTQF
jgi:hypothetical protein